MLDLYIGISLLLYGEWAEQEARLFSVLLKSGDVVVDAGAHIGSLSLALAHLVGKQCCNVLEKRPKRTDYDCLPGIAALADTQDPRAE